MGQGQSTSRPLQLIDVSKYENWYRLALSLELCVKPVLLNILHDPANRGLSKDEGRLYAELLLFKARAMGDRRINRLINIDQWDVMCHKCTTACPNPCPRNGKTNSNDFDITLIVLLIRNCTQLPAPRGGWQNDVQGNDESIAAYVVRAKGKRNQLNHSAMVCFADAQVFNQYRQDIRLILSKLRVKDFSKFDKLMTASLNHRIEEKIKALQDRVNFINEKTQEKLSNQNELIKEVKAVVECLRQNSASKSYVDDKLTLLHEKISQMDSEIRSEIQVLHSRIDTIPNTSIGRTLQFHVILANTVPSFEEVDVGLNTWLHEYMLQQLERYFENVCEPDPLEITITEITPVDFKGNEETTSPGVRFKCEVYSTNQTYINENLKDSLKSPKAKKIVSDIKTDLSSMIRNDLQTDTTIAVRKWKVSSLFVDITILKMDGKPWESESISVLSSVVQRVLKDNFPKDDVVVTHQSGKIAVNIQEGVKVFGTIDMSSCGQKQEVVRLFKELEGINIQYKALEQSDVQKTWGKTCQFKLSYAGMIIGKSGSRINRLNTLPDIIEVSLDTASSPTHCILTIKGSTQAAVQNVYDFIKKKTDVGRFAKFQKTLIESEENETLVVLTQYDGNREIAVVPQRGTKNLYTMEHFNTPSTQESLQNLSIDDSIERTNNDFQSISDKCILNTFQNTLDDIDISQVQSIHFNVTPGKMVFLGRDSPDPNKTLRRYEDGSLSLFAHKLKPVYVTFLNPSFKEGIFNKLKNNSFSCINKDTPEVFTKVHLETVEDMVRFSVKIALNKNLESVKEEDDPRLSGEKQRAIERVLKATTVEEVLQQQSSEESWKVSYRRQSLLVHPDKNFHRGANEAFKKLDHAYKAITDNKKNQPVLVFKTLKSFSSSKPPKVLSVKKNKRKVCAVTTFSDATLDIRASIVTMEKDPDGLSKHVRDVLNSCWENRDEHGGIQTPDGKTGVHISCIKQITAGHIWGKEIATSNGTALLEVKVNEIREKNDKSKEWSECLEIDMKLQDRQYKGMSAEDFTNDFLTMKKQWKKICPTLQ